MRLLLDTCTFLWILTDPAKVPGPVLEAYQSPGNQVFLSAASAWEIALKYSIGKLPLPSDPVRFVPAQRDAHAIRSLEITEEAALHQSRLPVLHRDLFDRLLVSQSIVQELTILTPDPLIAQYGCRTLW
jgi:PIN domain nuclease of toxin-antitoxin system